MYIHIRYIYFFTQLMHSINTFQKTVNSARLWKEKNKTLRWCQHTYHIFKEVQQKKVK